MGAIHSTGAYRQAVSYLCSGKTADNCVFAPIAVQLNVISTMTCQAAKPLSTPVFLLGSEANLKELVHIVLTDLCCSYPEAVHDTAERVVR